MNENTITKTSVTAAAMLISLLLFCLRLSLVSKFRMIAAASSALTFCPVQVPTSSIGSVVFLRVWVYGKKGK